LSDGIVSDAQTVRVELDSNTVERAIRPQTITRKNSLFAAPMAAAAPEQRLPAFWRRLK
jgi:hypothetical protein